ncbi:hypothetical protein N0V88_002638 [Collariella sp. IMI 366227]|nr:hypothetical protein N0V88_002638 [Collariella sp. IMI 366227]
MAPMKSPKSNSSSNHYGEDIVRQVDILASCYVVDSAMASLKGLHYCTTGLAGAECPPLAALTTTNQLALTPKAKSSSPRAAHVGRHGASTPDSAWQRRRGGATLRIREECERFFCETLRAMFLGERNAALQVPGLASVYDNTYNHNNTMYHTQGQQMHAAIGQHGQLTPPDDFPIADETMMGNRQGLSYAGRGILSWLEIWDYAGGSSFRGFVAEDAGTGTTSLFVFFDAHAITRDLKQALVALIELAESPLACSHMVICIERLIPEEDAKALTKGLQWAGFSLTTFDFWSGGFDVLSPRWLFMGMEV